MKEKQTHRFVNRAKKMKKKKTQLTFVFVWTI